MFPYFWPDSKCFTARSTWMGTFPNVHQSVWLNPFSVQKFLHKINKDYISNFMFNFSWFWWIRSFLRYIEHGLQSQWSSIVCVSFPLDKRCLVTKFAWMVLPFSWLFMPPLSVIIFQHSKFLKKTYIWTSETLHEVYVWVQFVFSFSTLYYSEIIGRYWPFDSENKQVCRNSL